MLECFYTIFLKCLQKWLRKFLYELPNEFLIFTRKCLRKIQEKFVWNFSRNYILNFSRKPIIFFYKFLYFLKRPLVVIPKFSLNFFFQIVVLKFLQKKMLIENSEIVQDNSIKIFFRKFLYEFLDVSKQIFLNSSSNSFCDSFRSYTRNFFWKIRIFYRNFSGNLSLMSACILLKTFHLKSHQNSFFRFFFNSSRKFSKNYLKSVLQVFLLECHLITIEIQKNILEFQKIFFKIL